MYILIYLCYISMQNNKYNEYSKRNISHQLSCHNSIVNIKSLVDKIFLPSLSCISNGCWPVRNFCLYPWWRHQIETFSALLAPCAGNSMVTGEFPSQSPATRSFDVCFNLRRNKWLSQHARHLWFETPSRSLWRYCNVKGYCQLVYKALIGIDYERVQVVREFLRIHHSSLPWSLIW